MPKTPVRTLAVLLVAAAIGVITVVWLSGQSSSARAAVAPGSTVRGSVVSGTNAEAPEGGVDQQLAAGGTAMVFSSQAKLDDLDTGEWTNVYVRDFARDRTVMISRGLIRRGDGGVIRDEGPPNGDSYQATISEDGRYVAFVTLATNMVEEDSDDDIDLIVCDRNPDGDDEFDEQLPNGAGRDYECFRANEQHFEEVNNDGVISRFRTDYPSAPRLSYAADRIVWEDLASDSEYRTIVRTASLGPSVTRPSQVVDAFDDAGAWELEDPEVSGNGRYIVATATYFPDGPPPFQAILRQDMDTGAVARVDLDLGATPQRPIYVGQSQAEFLANPAISGDGESVAFEVEEYRNFCTGGSDIDSDGGSDSSINGGSCWSSVANQPAVYLVRVPLSRSEVVSRDNEGVIVNGVLPSLSGDGRFVSFVTDNFNVHDGVDDEGEDARSCLIRGGDAVASEPMVRLNSVPPATEERDVRTSCQVVVRDLVVDEDRLVNELPRLPGTLASPGTGNECASEVPEGGTCVGNGPTPPFRASTPPTISRDGSAIGYDSDATNLVPGQPDANQRTDVFARTFRPELLAEPDPLEFGRVQVRDRFDRTVGFEHVGFGPLVIVRVDIGGRNPGDFKVGAQTCNGEAVVLQQTDRCEVSVGFEPLGAGDKSATLRLSTRDGRSLTVELLGTGSAGQVPPRPDAPRFAAGPDPVQFGPRLLLSSGAEPTVTVTNRGLSPLNVRGVAVVSALAPNDYAVASNTCNVPVPAGEQCRVTVRFSPTAPGERPAVLRFDSNAPGGPHLIGLTGAGSTPTVEVSPAVTQPGRVVMVSGLGFPPDRVVSLTMPGTVAKAVVRTALDGTFRAGLLVLPNSPIGNRKVVATVDTFPTIAPEKPLLIVTPTVSPAEFVVRG